PVGAWISVWAPDAITGQPFSWAGVGASKVFSNQLRVCGENTSSGPMRPGYSRQMGLSYRVRGAYFESCNCEAICPCRMIDGVPGGRSTYGICFGVLSWLIAEGRVGEVDVGGLAAVLVCRYDDDEPGSPWTIVLHVDRNGS